MAARVITIALGLALAFAPRATGYGQERERPILHEFFEYAADPVTHPSGALPLLPTPGRQTSSQGATPPPSEQDTPLVLTPGGPIAGSSFADPALGGLMNGPATPEGDVTLDNLTQAEGMLRYQTVFNPTLVPWKRGIARNHVARAAGQIAIGVREAPARPVSIGGSAPLGFHRFTGRVQVIARAGEAIPIPSVAPDMHVHAVQTTPPANVRIERDSADNYALTLDGDGAFDVTLQVSADPRYFGGPLPEISASPGPPRVADDIVRAAAPVIDALGIQSGASELEIVRALTHWFRAFEAGTLPPADAHTDPYQQLALSQIGVCRHRAQAFVITAAALGVVARYVHNEAHAFVEVRLSGFGWRRIDLGGAAEGLEALGDSHPTHRAGPDGFTDEELDGNSPYGDPTSAATGRPTPDTNEPEPQPQPQAPPGPNTNATAAPSSPAAANAVPQATAGTAPTEAARTFSVLSLSVQGERRYRGQTVHISGRLTRQDRTPLAGRPVRILLEDNAERSVDIGTLETDDAGDFEGDIALPPTLEAGRWSLRARFDGDDASGPAEAE